MTYAGASTKELLSAKTMIKNRRSKDLRRKMTDKKYHNKLTFFFIRESLVGLPKKEAAVRRKKYGRVMWHNQHYATDNNVWNRTQVECAAKITMSMRACNSCCCSRGLMGGDIAIQLVKGSNMKCGAWFAFRDIGLRAANAVARGMMMVFKYLEGCWGVRTTRRSQMVTQQSSLGAIGMEAHPHNMRWAHGSWKSAATTSDRAAFFAEP